MLYKQLGEEYKRAQRVKADVPVLVVIGNPPYDRQQIEAEEAGLVRRKGGWVRYGEGGKEGESIFKSFLKPMEALGWGVHAKNLYNDYVYFWRGPCGKFLRTRAAPASSASSPPPLTSGGRASPACAGYAGDLRRPVDHRLGRR